MAVYPNKQAFNSEFPTFDNVMLQMPEKLNNTSGLQITDNHNTFGDVPDNYNEDGSPRELPVDGYVEAQPHVECEVSLNRIVNAAASASFDFHLSGHNLELISSYAPGALESGQWVTLEMVESWKGENNIINPDAGFTRDQLLRWIHGFIGQEGYWGYSVFRDHAIADSPLYQMYVTIRRLLAVYPRLMTYHKGQRSSLVPGMEGFVPKSYSAVKDSMNVSWGMLEYHDVNGSKSIRHVGTCLDICAGETVLDAAAQGKPQWVNVDSGAILRLAIAGELTTENIMLKRLLEHGNVHFYNTALLLHANKHLVDQLPSHMQVWARQQMSAYPI